MIVPVVSHFSWAKRHKRDFEAVISIEDPDARRRLRFHTHPRPAHLILTFVDLDRPAPAPYDAWPVFRLADREQVERAIAFGREHADSSLLVHCQAGIGRSGAIALAILADRLSGHVSREETALAMLRANRPIVPNLHVTAIADDLLGCEGRLVAAVAACDAAHPENGKRRRENRAAHFIYYGLAKDL